MWADWWILAFAAGCFLCWGYIEFNAEEYSGFQKRFFKSMKMKDDSGVTDPRSIRVAGRFMFIVGMCLISYGILRRRLG